MHGGLHPEVPVAIPDLGADARFDQIAFMLRSAGIRGALSVPVEVLGGPIGTLDLFTAIPRAWDDSEVAAAHAYAGVVASLLGAAAKAELKGALADQLQVALDSRGLIERAKGALMERERLDDQEAFTHLRRAARSSGRKLSEVAAEVAAGQPLPRGRTRPTSTQAEQPKSVAGG
jgi:GAF domain-containing protein